MRLVAVLGIVGLLAWVESQPRAARSGRLTRA